MTSSTCDETKDVINFGSSSRVIVDTWQNVDYHGEVKMDMHLLAFWLKSGVFVFGILGSLGFLSTDFIEAILW